MITEDLGVENFLNLISFGFRFDDDRRWRRLDMSDDIGFFVEFQERNMKDRVNFH